MTDLDEPTTTELSNYITRSDAIAPILIEDVRRLTVMPEGSHMDGWYMGNVPARMFRIVGMLIHTDFWDNEMNWRTKYVVEDGSGSLEITHTEQKPPPHAYAPLPLSPNARGKQPVHRSAPTYAPSGFAAGERRRAIAESLHGAIVSFTVRVKQGKNNARFADLVTLEPLRSVQEEVNHWNHVERLKKTRYRERFVLPTYPPPPIVAAPSPPLLLPPPVPRTPVKSKPQKASMSTPPLPVKSPARRPRPPPPIQSPVREHVQRPSLILLQAPYQVSAVRTGDLVPSTFKQYLDFFIRHDPSVQQLPPDSQHRAGFTIEYLQSVPDLRYLARRVVLAEARRGMKEFLVKKKRAALEVADPNLPSSSSGSLQSSSAMRAKERGLKKPPEMTPDRLTRGVNELFLGALRDLLESGNLILCTGEIGNLRAAAVHASGTGAKEYPSSLGPFRLWDPAPPLSAGTLAADETGSTFDLTRASISSSRSKSRSKSHSSKTNWREGLQEHDGPIDLFRPDSFPIPVPTSMTEVYFLVTAHTLKLPILRAFVTLKKRQSELKDRSARMGNIGGGTPGEILDVMKASDDLWAKINEGQVKDSLAELEKEDKVENWEKDKWRAFP